MDTTNNDNGKRDECTGLLRVLFRVQDIAVPVCHRITKFIQFTTRSEPNKTLGFVSGADHENHVPRGKYSNRAGKPTTRSVESSLESADMRVCAVRSERIAGRQPANLRWPFAPRSVLEVGGSRSLSGFDFYSWSSIQSRSDKIA